MLGGHFMSTRIERALISVSDKIGLAAFALALHENGVQIYSTGGTAAHIREHDVPVRDVSDYTEFLEMMDGRLKTLHPKIFGGILCRYDNPDDMQSLAEHGIETFGLVIVNLYPFQKTVAQSSTTWDQAIEKIDIGGPSLVRAAAKNCAFTTVATSPNQYDRILQELRDSDGATSPQLRHELAAAAFEHTAQYDRAIANYFARNHAEPGSSSDVSQSEDASEFPVSLTLDLERKATLRYGENPHQTAAVYRHCQSERTGANLLNAEQLNGKELSYNNLLDADAALTIARSLPDCGVAVIKHTNPCGAASAASAAEATERAMAGDPVSAFGSILGFNAPVDMAAAEFLATPGLFVEAIVAPSFSREALDILTTKPKWKNNVRLLAVGTLDQPPEATHYRCIDGGLLVQQVDLVEDQFDAWQVVTDTQPSEAQMDELRFAWTVVRHVKSNAIVLCRDRSLVGVGAGQMSRVDSVQIAIRKAGERVQGSVLASDAFFPFADSIHEAAGAGVQAVIEPGGSRRDEEVIAACNEHGLPMVFTGRRHFKH